MIRLARKQLLVTEIPPQGGACHETSCVRCPLGTTGAVAAAPAPAAASASPAASRSTTARSSPASCSSSRPASPGTTCPPNSAAAAARPVATTSGSGTSAGVWRQLHALLLAELNGADQIDWERALIDASFAEAPEGGEDTGPNPTDRGKSGSKHHVLTDAHGIPLAATVTAANVNEVTQVFQVLTDMPPVGGKPGPKRQQPERLQGDRGYDSEPVRQTLTLAGHHPGLGGQVYRTRQRAGRVPLGRGADHLLAACLRPAPPPAGSAHGTPRGVPPVSPAA